MKYIVATEKIPVSYAVHACTHLPVSTAESGVVSSGSTLLPIPPACPCRCLVAEDTQWACTQVWDVPSFPQCVMTREGQDHCDY